MQGRRGWLALSVYTEHSGACLLQSLRDRFSLGKSSDEADPRAGGVESMSSEVWWGSRRGAHNGKRSLHQGGVVERRKAEIESEKKS